MQIYKRKYFEDMAKKVFFGQNYFQNQGGARA